MVYFQAYKDAFQEEVEVEVGRQLVNIGVRKIIVLKLIHPFPDKIHSHAEGCGIVSTILVITKILLCFLEHYVYEYCEQLVIIK